MSNPYAPTTSFSGSDMVVAFVFPNARPVTIGTASTISYSTFREKRQVRTLGRISSKGVTKGPRTIGGSLIFTSIRQHVINDIMDELRTMPMYANYDKIKPDELPPFDIIVTFANEYGQNAKLIIYGVTVMDDGKTLSIEDIFTENQMTYIARDIEHMKSTTDNPNSLYNKSYLVNNLNETLGKFKIDKIDSSQAKVNQEKQLKQLNDKYKGFEYLDTVTPAKFGSVYDHGFEYMDTVSLEEKRKLNKYVMLMHKYPSTANVITVYLDRDGKNAEEIQSLVASQYDWIIYNKDRNMGDSVLLQEFIKRM